MDYPRGFWSEEENFWSELRKICEELGHFPSASYLNKNGCSAALPYIQKAGGFEAVSTKLGFDTKSEVLEKKKQDKLEKAQEKEDAALLSEPFLVTNATISFIKEAEIKPKLPLIVKTELEPEEIMSESVATEMAPEDLEEVFAAPLVPDEVLLAEPVIITEEAKELIDSALVAYHKFLPVIEVERKVKEEAEKVPDVSQPEPERKPNFLVWEDFYKVLAPLYSKLKEVPRSKYLLDNKMFDVQKAIKYHGGRDACKDKLLVTQARLKSK